MQDKIINILQDKIPMLKWQKDFFNLEDNTGVCYLEMEAHGVIEFNVVVQAGDRRIAKMCTERLPIIFKDLGAVHFSGLRSLGDGEYTSQVQFRVDDNK